MTTEVFKHHEQWFRALIEHSADGIVLMRYDGIMTYASPSAERIIGYTPEELVGMNCVSFIHPDDQPKVAFDVKHMLDHHEDFVSIVHRLRHKDGSWRWIDGTITNLLHDPLIKSLVGNYRDITERKLAEERLRQSEERYRVAEHEADHRASQLSAIFEAITDIVIVCDKQGRLIHANSAFYSSTGLQPDDELSFATLSDYPAHLQPLDNKGTLLPQEQWPLVRVLRGERLTSKNTEDIFFRNQDGRMWSFDMRGAPIYEASGKIVGGVVVLRDVTRRRELERRLQRSEREFRSLVESNIIGVIVIDVHGRIHEVNDCFVHMLGYDREDLLSAISWQQLTPPQYRQKEAEAIATLFAAGTVLPWEKEYLRKDGTLLPTLVGGTLIDQEQGLALAVILDISDRKEVEQRKQEFLSMVSHELRTPLTGIVGFLELAQIYLDALPVGLSSEMDTLIDKVKLFVAEAEHQSGIQTRLVEELLDVSKMEKHTFELSLKKCNLSKIVQNVVTIQQHIAGNARIDLLPLSQELIPVLADEDRIGEVLVNYLTNALKYSPTDQKIEVGVIVEETNVRVYVRDQGPGITPIQQQRIWERFYQTNIPEHGAIERSGLGLGLYISKIIIEQHKGQVGVESRFGGGSTFWFALPL